MRKGIQRLPSGRYPATNENRLLSKGSCVVFDHITLMRAEKMHFVTSALRGSTVVKVLRYKSEGRWFDPRWCHWNFSST